MTGRLAPHQRIRMIRGKFRDARHIIDAINRLAVDHERAQQLNRLLLEWELEWVSEYPDDTVTSGIKRLIRQQLNPPPPEDDDAE